MNNITTYGRVASDVTIRDVNGRTVANFRFASTNRRKDNEGKYMTNFYTVSAWGGLADMAKHLHKGSRAVIGGELSVRSYVGTDGVGHQSLEIDANAIDFGDTKAEAEAKAGTYAQESRPSRAAEPPAAENTVDDLDELPF